VGEGVGVCEEGRRKRREEKEEELPFHSFQRLSSVIPFVPSTKTSALQVEEGVGRGEVGRRRGKGKHPHHPSIISFIRDVSGGGG